ncbi:putative tyrosine phosphatase 123R [Diplonema papillatum]|nr:putative tyrosine phosphatase 123R [Diplonema papillatum]
MEYMMYNMHKGNEIVPGLWLGNHVGGESCDWMRSIGVELVVHCRNHAVKSEVSAAFDTIDVRVEDDYDSDILAHLPRAVAAIHERLGRDPPGSVFVHCQMGRSRSAAVVAAYLMQHHEPPMALPEALAAIKRKRTTAEPNRAFLLQLVCYEAQARRSTVPPHQVGSRALSNTASLLSSFAEDRLQAALADFDGTMPSLAQCLRALQGSGNTREQNDQLQTLLQIDCVQKL